MSSLNFGWNWGGDGRKNIPYLEIGVNTEVINIW